MKKIASVVCFVISSSYLFAQTPHSPFSAEIKFGAAVPVGKFRSKSTNSEGQSAWTGWAQPGPVLQFVFNYQFNKNYGVSLLFGGQQNQQDARSVTTYIQGTNNGVVTNSSADTWKLGEILGGGFVHIPFSGHSKLFFNANLRAGILKTAIPGYSYSQTTTENGFPYLVAAGFRTSIKLPWAFCYQLSTGINWQFIKRFYATADIGYNHAAPSFHYKIYTGTPNNITYTEYKVKYPVASLNVLAGVGYRF